MKLKLLIICSFVMPMLVQGQQTYRYYDSLTYACYTAQQWELLVSSANDALREGHDGFYLRVRLGAAYYALEKYTSAIPHLESARVFNSGAPYLNYLLYSAYMKLGRTGDAQYIANAAAASGEDKASKAFPLFAEIGLGAGIGFSNIKDNIRREYFTGQGKVHGLTHVNHRTNFMQYEMLHFVGRRTKIFHSFMQLNIDKTLAESFPGIDTSVSYRASQPQYYLMIEQRLRKGLFVSPAVHIVSHSSSTPFFIYMPLTLEATQDSFDTSFRDYWAGLRLRYHYKTLLFEGGGSISKFGGQRFRQSQLLMRWQPCQKREIFLSGGLCIHHAPEAMHYVFSFGLDTRMGERVKLMAYLTAGDYSNTAINHGYLVYNLSEQARARIGCEWVVKVNKHLDLKLNYSFLDRAALYYYEKADLITVTDYIDYQSHTINGGIVWKFY